MRCLLLRRNLLQCLTLLLLCSAAAAPARAQGIELAALEVQRHDGELTLDFDVRLALPRGVEDAMQRGVPVYFVAEAALWPRLVQSGLGLSLAATEALVLRQVDTAHGPGAQHLEQAVASDDHAGPWVPGLLNLAQTKPPCAEYRNLCG